MGSREDGWAWGAEGQRRAGVKHRQAGCGLCAVCVWGPWLCEQVLPCKCGRRARGLSRAEDSVQVCSGGNMTPYLKLGNLDSSLSSADVCICVFEL